MADSFSMKAPAHYLRVDLSDQAEAEYWLIVLDAARREVVLAISAVGTDALEVQLWLAQARRATASR